MRNGKNKKENNVEKRPKISTGLLMWDERSMLIWIYEKVNTVSYWHIASCIDSKRLHELYENSLKYYQILTSIYMHVRSRWNPYTIIFCLIYLKYIEKHNEGVPCFFILIRFSSHVFLFQPLNLFFHKTQYRCPMLLNVGRN